MDAVIEGMPDPIADCYVVWTMNKYGGSFAQSLAKAALMADETNLEKIKATWPELWKQYSKMAWQVLRKEIEQDRQP